MATSHKLIIGNSMSMAEIPDDIAKEALVETLCQYTEDDYYEWLKDNFKSFFNHGDPDWEWIRGRLTTHEKQ